MTETFVQLATDGTGKKIRARSRTISGHLVHEQAVFQAAPDTYYAVADAVNFVQNKHHISILNAAGSGSLVRIRRMFVINTQLVAATGVAVRFDFKRATAHSGGISINPEMADTTNPAVPAQITIRTNASPVTEGNLLWPFTCTNDEVGATQAFPSSALMQYSNIMVSGPEVQELTLREGQGLTVKQITNSTIGSFAWFMVFTLEAS